MASSPLVYDLFCGLGGWSEGFLAEGYRCVGFDIERHDYGTGGYPGELVLLWGDVPALIPQAASLAKVGGFSWSDYGKLNYKPRGFNVTAVQRLYADRDSQGVKQHGSGPIWWRTGNGALPSKSSRRKAASAQIAKIPFPLAQHIARVFKESEVAA